jgi:DNA polymerase-3 subunit epsilon
VTHMELTFVAIDVETANPDRASICQVGAVAVQDGEIVDTLDTLIDPETYLDPWNIEIRGISESTVHGAPCFPDIASRLREFVNDRVVASHTPFDRTACDRVHERYELQSPDRTWLDTARVSRRAWTQFATRGYGLSNVAKHCGIEFRHHSAVEDARAAALILPRRAVKPVSMSQDGLGERARPFSQSLKMASSTDRSPAKLSCSPEPSRSRARRRRPKPRRSAATFETL